MNRFEKPWRSYLSLLAVTTHTLLVAAVFLVVTNWALGKVFHYWDFSKIKQVNPINKRLTEIRRELYPGLSDDEIDILLAESQPVPFVFDTYTQFKSRPIQGKYVHIDEVGYRRSSQTGPWPPDPAQFNIFVFGGSTTFGCGTADNESIPAYLQDIIRKNTPKTRISVYNFGRPGYFSVQERILFEKFLNDRIIPKMAIFIDGLNDFRHPDNQPLFTEDLVRYMNNDTGEIMKNLIGRKLLETAIYRAWVSVRSGFISHALFGRDSGVQGQPFYPSNTEQIQGIIDRYWRNRFITDAVAKAHNVTSIHIWQPVPSYKGNPERNPFYQNHIMRTPEIGYPMMAEQVKRRRDLGNFLWCADLFEHNQQLNYVDSVHYSPSANRLIAEKIYGFIKSRL